MVTAPLKLSGRHGTMARAKGGENWQWPNEVLQEIWKYKLKNQCSWVQVVEWVTKEYGLVCEPGYLSRWLKKRLGLSREELDAAKPKLVKKGINDMTREELAARGIEITDEMLHKAQQKPVWCSERRWRMELGRRERASYYDSLPDKIYDVFL